MAEIAVEASQAPSIAELRATLSGKTEAPAAAAPNADTPAAEGETAAGETAPDSGTEVKQAALTEHGERGADGKFKPKAGAEAKASEEPEAVPAGVQKRIDKAIKAQRQAERERDEANQKLANQGPRPGDGRQPAAINAPPATTPKPDPAKPETYKAYGDKYEDYLEALTDWKVDQRRAKDNAEADTARAADAQRKIGESHNARVEKAKAGKDDWDETMEAGASVAITQALLDFIRQSEHGPDTAYYLLKHPEEMARVLALPAVLQVAEAGAIANAQFAKPPAASTPAAKKPLPKPAAAVGGAAGAKQLSLNDADLSMRDFKRLARAQLSRS